MKRRLLAAFVVGALAVASGGVIYAITNGHPDGNGHPYVGVLDEPVTGLGMAVLPPEGFVDNLPMKADIDLVGYGVQWKQQVSGPPGGRWAFNGLRYFARSKYVGSEEKRSAQFLKLTANPGNGKGGICFGDSGGPDLLGNMVLGVNSFVTNYNCAGVTYSMRIDRADALDWVNSFLAE